MTLGELRASWLLFGLVLPLSFADSPRPVWIAAAAVPWMAGVLALGYAWRKRDTTSARFLAGRRERVAALVTITVLVVIAHVFGVTAAVLAFAWLAAGLLCIAVLGGRDRASSALVAVAILLGSITVISVALELTLKALPVAHRLGAPAQLTAWQERYDQLWTRNAFGFRSPYERVEKEPGVFRIAALGDSFTWGDKIADTDSTWPGQLEQILARRSDRVVEVVNMAERGFTTVNEAERLRRVGWQFDPDLVLLQWGVNDALPSGPNYANVGITTLCGEYFLVPARFRTEVVQSSVLLALLEQQYARFRRRGRPCHDLLAGLYQPTSPSWTEFSGALREIAAAGHERQVPVVLVLFPLLIQGDWAVDDYPLSGVHGAVARLGVELNLHVLDLLPLFASQGGKWQRWWATHYDGHPGVAAHGLAAAAVDSLLLETGLLDRR